MLLTNSEWRNTAISFFSFMLSFGLLRTWPIYFTPLTDFMTQYNNYNSSSVEYTNVKLGIGRTSSLLSIGLTIGSLSCGAILPVLGNKKTFFMSGTSVFILFNLLSFSLRFIDSIRIVLPVTFAVMFMIGVFCGIMNTCAQNQLAKSIDKERMLLAFCFMILGSSAAYFTLPTLFSVTSEKFGLKTSLHITG